MSVNKIIDRIWLGDRYASQSETFIKENNINIIINCSKNLPNSFEGLFDVEYYRVNVNDRLKNEDITEMSAQIDDVSSYIFQKYVEGNNILIHCRKGRQRSATVLCAFMFMIYPEKSLYDLMIMIKEKRPMAFNGGKSVNFIDVLTD